MYWILALIFGAFLLVDICGHLLFKIKRKFPEWMLIVIMIIITTGMLTKGTINFFTDEKGEKEDFFIAYKYLSDGDVELAKKKLAELNGDMIIPGKVLGVIADTVEQDYINGYFEAEKLLESEKLNATQKEYILKAQNMCKEKLGLTNTEDTDTEDTNTEDTNTEDTDTEDTNTDGEDTGDETNEYTEYLQMLANESDEYNSNIENGSDSAKALMDEYLDTFDYSADDEAKYTEEYTLDKNLNNTNISEITLEDIDSLENKYGNTEEVMRIRCKYYVYQKDFTNAKKYAKKLIDKFRNEENYVIYTDIIAQEAYQKELAGLNSDDCFDLDDSEVKKLVDRAKDKEEEAATLQNKYGDSDEDIQDKIDELLNKADELRKEANYVPVKRAINYILAKIPSGGDTTGYYNLQLAKLYLAEGNRDKANDYLYDVINDSVDIDDSSSIKKQVDEVVSKYNQLTDDEYSSELTSAVDELVKAQSNEVVPNDESTVNGTFDSYVNTSLKYDRINIHISKIDASKYPDIKAYVNINGTKDGSSELASDFVESDFDIIDTLYEIKNFKINKDTDKVSIGIVMDKSGSMQGAAIYNAQEAAVETVNHMLADNQKISVIAYDDSAYVAQGLTNRKESLKKEISKIVADGGTNISAGIECAIGQIKNEDGARAIILMSDGQDGGSQEDMDNALENAVNEGISIYTVAFGECDDAYMRNIADATGGKFIKASDSAELSDIYLALQRYIVNNYCFEYTVTQNKDTDPRSFTANISKYNTSATKQYFIKDENDQIADASGESIVKIDENTIGISSVTPGCVFTNEIEKGIEVTVTGGGFVDGTMVSISDVPLADIKIKSKTELTGTLKGKIEAGIYDVYVKNSDGKMAIGNGLFTATKVGTTTSVRVGSTTVTADRIGMIDDNTLMASGNVMINGFIHSAGDMKIKMDSISEDLELEGKEMVFLGSSGTFEGTSKLYVSYSQMAEANNEKVTSLIMNGKDFVIQDTKYLIDVKGNDVSLDTTISDFDISIPFLMDIDLAEVNLYSNRLQIDVKELNITKIVSSVKESLNGADKSNKTHKTSLEAKSRSTANKFNLMSGTSASLSVALTPNGMQFGGEAKLSLNDSVVFGNFGVNEVGLKFNSLDPDNEYWKVSGKIDFGRIIKGFGSTGVEGFDGSISSYYWLPDKLDINASLNPGITVYKIIDINSIGGELQGMSSVMLKTYETLVSPDTYKILGTDIDSDAYTPQDIALTGKIGAEADLFASFKGNNKLFEKYKDWGVVGKVNGKVTINFSKPEFLIGADMTFLGKEKASAEAKINSSGLDIGAKISLDISGFGLKLKGGSDANLGGNLTGAYMKFAMNGSADCSPLDIHTKGDVSIAVEFDWDFNMASVTVGYKDGSKNKEGRLWYKDDGELFLWDKIHTSSN